MSLDPKKDPQRRCMPVLSWPAADRCAWEAATIKGDVLEPGGAGADWAPLSQRKITKGYGRWLTWQAAHGLLDIEATPAARITPERVRDYVVDLRRINAPTPCWRACRSFIKRSGRWPPNSTGRGSVASRIGCATG